VTLSRPLAMSPDTSVSVSSEISSRVVPESQSVNARTTFTLICPAPSRSSTTEPASAKGRPLAELSASRVPMNNVFVEPKKLVPAVQPLRIVVDRNAIFANVLLGQLRPM